MRKIFKYLMLVVMAIVFSAAVANISLAANKINWSKSNTATQYKRPLITKRPLVVSHNAAHRIVNIKNKKNDSFAHLNR